MIMLMEGLLDLIGHRIRKIINHRSFIFVGIPQSVNAEDSISV